MLKDIFDKMTESKVEWHESRNDWSATLEREFPAMMKIGVNDTENEIEKELDILLSSSVINKSGRFEITLKQINSWQGLRAFLTRKPGLHYLHSGSRDITYRNYNVLLDNGDLVDNEKISTKADEGRREVQFSSLKSEIKINQDKLNEFFQHLKTFLELVKERQTKFLVMSYDISELSHHKGNKELRVYPKSKGYTLELGVETKKAKRGYDSDLEKIEWNSLNVYGLDLRGYDDESKDVEADKKIKTLRLIQVNFSVFYNAMREYEIIKAEYVKKLNDLYESLKVTNVAFRVLNKITNND